MKQKMFVTWTGSLKSASGLWGNENLLLSLERQNMLKTLKEWMTSFKSVGIRLY